VASCKEKEEMKKWYLGDLEDCGGFFLEEEGEEDWGGSLQNDIEEGE